MVFTWSVSSSEISFCFLESVSRRKPIVPKDFTRFCCLSKSGTTPDGVRKKAFVSSHLVPEHMDGSYLGKKQLDEPSLRQEFVRTLLIDNYDSYTYNIYQELSVINGLPPVVICNDEWSWEDVLHYLYEEKAFDNVVISPGPGSPTCAADIGICLRLLLECEDIPILGVCLGHQALGYVHGAQVVHAPEPIHGRLSDIEHNRCGLFHGIPSGQNSGFKVVRYHSLVIDPHSLPKEIIPIAWTSTDTTPSLGIQNFNSNHDSYERKDGSQLFAKYLSTKSEKGLQLHSSNLRQMHTDNILMGVMHSSRPHYGVQFHPESVATCYGRQIFKNFADITKDYWFQLDSSLNSWRNVQHAACSQVPNVVTQLFHDVARIKHGVNGLDQKHDRLCNLMNTSYSRNAKGFKLKWRKVECSTIQVGGAQNIFLGLFGSHDAGNTFWLDSSSTEMNRARFSFMGGKGGPLWRQLTFRLSGSRLECNHKEAHVH